MSGHPMSGQPDPRRNAAPLSRPATAAAPFSADEIFFSRTDERGVIRAFNDVFVRIADYPAATLIGAPHRIIRHPDMPKGVFHLMWEGIKAGHPIGAYVKNRARDGLHYWVYALVTPVEGGFLSVRIKPTAALLPVIEAEYAALLAAEAAGLSPEASAAALCARLQAIGHPSHAAFQTEALLTEMQSRRVAVGQMPDGDLDALHRMTTAMRAVRAEIAALTLVLQGARLLTVNMRLVAAKLTEGRRTLSEIARSYGMALDEMQAHVATFAALSRPEGRHAACPEERALFVLCAARLMEEVCRDFRRAGSGQDGEDHAQEAAVLAAVAGRYDTEAGPALAALGQSARQLQRDVAYLRRHVVGLSTVRIACRVESGTLRHRAAALDTIIGRIDDLQQSIFTALDRIDTACQRTVGAYRDWQGRQGGGRHAA